MASTTPFSTTSTTSYDEILSISPDDDSTINFDLTNYLIIIFPLYIFAILWNFLTIYSIFIGKVYRQYLSNVLLAVISIGSLLNIHGRMFLILLRWTNNSASNQLCSTSIYLRDSGTIIISTHVFLLAFERILAYLKKHPNNLHNNLIQKGHFFLILLSFINIILALTVPIYTLKHSVFAPSYGLCLPIDTKGYKNYFNWIYYGFGHSLLWLALILLIIFLFRRNLVSYSTLIPMNRIIFIISLFSCMNLLIETLFDDVIGIGKNRPINSKDVPPIKLFYLMNFRDTISILHKLLIGVLFFILRPEIRSWLYESIRSFQTTRKEPVIPQMLDIRNDLDENYDEIDDGNLQFRSDS